MSWYYDGENEYWIPDGSSDMAGEDAWNAYNTPSLAQTALSPSGTSGGMAAPSNLVTVPDTPSTGDGEAWQPGSPGYSYDPSTVAQGSDGRYYAIDTNGNLQMIASANGMTGGFGTGTKLQEGPKAPITKAMVDQQFSTQGGGSFFGDMGELLGDFGSALGEAAPGIALIGGAGLLGGAFPSIYGGLGGGATTIAGDVITPNLIGGAGADTLGAGAFTGVTEADLAMELAPSLAETVTGASAGGGLTLPAASSTPSLSTSAFGIPTATGVGMGGSAGTGIGAGVGGGGIGTGLQLPVALGGSALGLGLNSGSAGTGFNEGISNLNPSLGAQLNPVISGLTPAGVAAGVTNPVGANPAYISGTTPGTVGSGSTLGSIGPDTVGTGAGTGVPGLGNTGTGTPGSYQFPWGDALKGLIGAYTSNESAKTMADALKYAADKADPFSAQRPAYQDKFNQMTNDPNLFKNTYGDKLTSMVNDPNVLKTQYSDKLKSITNDPNYFKNEYGNLLSQKVNDPNLFKTPYGDELQRRMADPNLFKNPYGTAAQGMINDPNAFTNPMSKQAATMALDPNFLNNKYGAEAGKMMQDPNYFINNPMMLALRDNALNSTQARLSSQVGGDQGSISYRDTLNKSILAAQAPSLQNYFNSVVGGDTQSQANSVNYLNSLFRAGEADTAGQNTRFSTLVSGDANANQNMNNYLNMLSGANTSANNTTGNYLNTLSGANQNTQGNALDYFKSLGSLDTSGQASINDFMRTLSGANTSQNANTTGYLNTIGEAAGAKVNPAAAGNILATGAQSMYNANQQTAGNLGYAASAIGTGSQPSFLESLYRASQGTSPTNANLGSLFSF